MALEVLGCHGRDRLLGDTHTYIYIVRTSWAVRNDSASVHIRMVNTELGFLLQFRSLPSLPPAIWVLG